VREITISKKWLFVLRRIKRFQNTTTELREVVKNVFKFYNFKNRVKFVRIFRSLRKKGILNGKIVYLEKYGKKRPYLYLKSVPKIEVIHKKDDKVKVRIIKEKDLGSFFSPLEK